MNYASCNLAENDTTMTIHAGISVIGALATLVTIVECLQRHNRCKRLIASSVAFACLSVLAFMPCYPYHPEMKQHEPPAAIEPANIDHAERLLLAHYRRIRTEREISDAWPK